MSTSLKAHSMILDVVRQSSPREDLRRHRLDAWRPQRQHLIHLQDVRLLATDGPPIGPLHVFAALAPEPAGEDWYLASDQLYGKPSCLTVASRDRRRVGAVRRPVLAGVKGSLAPATARRRGRP